jgi:hypothetical protein
VTTLPRAASGYVCEHRFDSSDVQYMLYEFEMREVPPVMLLKAHRSVSR